MHRPPQRKPVYDVDEWVAQRTATKPAGFVLGTHGQMAPVIDLETSSEIDLTEECSVVDLTADDDEPNSGTIFSKTASTNRNRKRQRKETRRMVASTPGGSSSLSATASPPSSMGFGVSRSGTAQGRTDLEPPRKRSRALGTPSQSFKLDRRGLPRTPRTVGLDSDWYSALEPYNDDSMDLDPTPLPESTIKLSPTSQLTAKSLQTMSAPVPGGRLPSPTSRLRLNVVPSPIFESGPEPKLDEEDNSDEDYECIHARFDLEDESLWKPRKQNSERLDIDVIEAIEDWTLSTEENTKRKLRTSKSSSMVRPPENGKFIWDQLKRIRKASSASRVDKKPTILKQDPGYGRIRSEKGMHIKASFKVAPGAINRIEQHSGWVAIASSCIGGQADAPDEEPNPYNRSGSLLTWNGQYNVLSGHFDRKEYGEKHYTINDAKFNPAGNCIVSAGMDKRVKVWRRSQGSKVYSGGYHLDVYEEGVPHELAFHPATSMLAVGVKDVHIYPNLEPTAKRARVNLPLASATHPTHAVGAIRWDVGRSHILYASSEPQESDLEGVHSAFDVATSMRILNFSVTEAGDAMAVNERVLALTTRGTGSNYLRLFDITNKRPNHTQEITLEPFSRRARVREVSCMTFSPDQIYLALARTDNSVHVYDSRMLSKGVLHMYQHNKARFVSPGSVLYGVPYAQWVPTHTGQNILLSGGEDGCVRSWNPMWSNEEPSNGRKMVEVNSDIGFFSVGDPHKGGHDLVVGDSSGEVTIFNGLLNYL